MTEQIDLVRRTALDFVREFIRHPYLCYTEHGQHALFYTRLYNAMPEENRYVQWKDQHVCVIQKEYPTFGKLGKPKRQHWDIAVIKNPPECDAAILKHSFDYLRLSAVVEFGLNEGEDHLLDDIDRLCCTEANVDAVFVVHLYRLSTAGDLFSGRDRSSRSHQIVTQDRLMELINGREIEVIVGFADACKQFSPCGWHYRKGKLTFFE